MRTKACDTLISNVNFKLIVTYRSGDCVVNMPELPARNQPFESLASRPRRNRTRNVRSATVRIRQGVALLKFG